MVTIKLAMAVATIKLVVAVATNRLAVAAGIMRLVVAMVLVTIRLVLAEVPSDIGSHNGLIQTGNGSGHHVLNWQ